MTWTLLHDACDHQDAAAVRNLANRPELAVALDAHGSTPLHIYLANPHPDPDAVRALLKASPPDISDYHGDTILHIAASNPTMDSDLLKDVLMATPNAISKANREGLLPLHMACRFAAQNVDAIRMLVEANPDAIHKRIKVSDTTS